MKNFKKLLALLTIVFLLGSFSFDTSYSVPASSRAAIHQTSVNNTKVLHAKKKAKKVWISKNGSKYHSKKSCSKMKNPKKVTLKKAKDLGYTSCKKCH